MSVRARVDRWFDQRYPVPAIRDALAKQAHKLLPPHVGWFHTLGGLLTFLAIQQILTGILLMVYYRPTTEGAFESVQFVMTKAAFGWLIRGLHAWGASLMVAVLVLHMLRVFLMGAFKRPRELTWVGGVLLFFLTLGFGFTGYLLPWSQLSYWATTVGTEMSASIPGIGAELGTLMRGGEAVGQETLSRFYVLHVVVLPWVLIALMIAHIVLIRMQGLAPLAPVGEQEVPTPEEGIRFAPEHLSRELVVFPLFFGLLMLLVILFPPEMGEKADPTVTPEGIKPEWYFLPTYQFLKYLPKYVGLALAALPPLLLLAWPFLDRSPWRRPSQRRLSITLGLAALLVTILLGLVGWLSESERHVLGRVVRFDMYGWPQVVADER
jgi:quinol-cytochrome oxidoreductase complex cytochrome b subunit